jgi:hypothetical protein
VGDVRRPEGSRGGPMRMVTPARATVTMARSKRPLR